ncbi:MAG TPA: VOC family protein [Candidatus Acidoferrales bacterium]|nr:VOC family protein [Candidatus Acidoferrales bacterium]
MIESLHFEARLHHVGFVVRSIESEIAGFTSSILASWDAKIFHDPLQKVRVTFLQTPNPTDALIELVEPAADDSPVEQFLRRGAGLHHLCYEIPDLDAHLDKMQAGGGGHCKAATSRCGIRESPHRLGCDEAEATTRIPRKKKA